MSSFCHLKFLAAISIADFFGSGVITLWKSGKLAGTRAGMVYYRGPLCAIILFFKNGFKFQILSTQQTSIYTYIWYIITWKNNLCQRVRVNPNLLTFFNFIVYYVGHEMYTRIIPLFRRLKTVIVIGSPSINSTITDCRSVSLCWSSLLSYLILKLKK